MERLRPSGASGQEAQQEEGRAQPGVWLAWQNLKTAFKMEGPPEPGQSPKRHQDLPSLNSPSTGLRHESEIHKVNHPWRKRHHSDIGMICHILTQWLGFNHKLPGVRT